VIVSGLAALVRLALGAAVGFRVELDPDRQRVFVANHSSHLDTLLIWASLPTRLRARTRPVAAGDYWGRSAPRRFLAGRLLRAVLIDREGGGRQALERMQEALAAGDSLLLFPEGTRGRSNVPQQFKSGIYHLCVGRPELEVVPVYLENLNRVLPKGEFLPVPLLARITFGVPAALGTAEDKQSFLNRLRGQVLELKGPPS
jgi:1-acyl-sn-glycerol-3-phosphate acyltransferase